jgi:biphenyl 2,3-dioxygenase ferredoxin subunit
MTFTRVCSVADIPFGEGLRIEGIGDIEPIALFNVDGEILAVQDTCTHGDWSLAEGYVDGDTIECSLHLARFCLRTGAVCNPPATRPLKTYPVRLDGADVLIDLSVESALG